VLGRSKNSGLPDLSGFENQYFDLATQFDITHYVQILADSAPGSEEEKTMDRGTHRESQGTSQKKAQASVEESEWSTW